MNEAPPPPNPQPILGLATGFFPAKAVLSAVELGVFSELATGALDREALSARVGIHARGAADFFDALVALGLLERDAGYYRNAPAADWFLDRAKPTYIGEFLDLLNELCYPRWGSLTDALRTGTPQSGASTTADYFSLLYADPARLEQFLRSMTVLSAPSALAIAERFPWATVSTFVDLGTAQGGLAVAVAARHEHLTGVGFDLPAVQPTFEALVTARGLGHRLQFHPGDFFVDPLPAADVYVLGHVLHDWGLDEKLAVLRRVYDALSPGGAVIAYDMVIDDDRRRNVSGLLMSLNMLVDTPGGFDYTGADGCEWMRGVGFEPTTVVPLAGPESMVIGVKPGQLHDASR